MATASVQASKQINQPASKIYGAIADYQKHHPNFLPRNYFKKLEIESGGVGAGTIFKADMDVYGNKSTLRMKVTEPQPGRDAVTQRPRPAMEKAVRQVIEGRMVPVSRGKKRSKADPS